MFSGGRRERRGSGAEDWPGDKARADAGSWADDGAGADGIPRLADDGGPGYPAPGYAGGPDQDFARGGPGPRGPHPEPSAGPWLPGPAMPGPGGPGGGPAAGDRYDAPAGGPYAYGAQQEPYGAQQARAPYLESSPGGMPPGGARQTNGPYGGARRPGPIRARPIQASQAARSTGESRIAQGLAAVRRTAGDSPRMVTFGSGSPAWPNPAMGPPGRFPGRRVPGCPARASSFPASSFRESSSRGGRNRVRSTAGRMAAATPAAARFPCQVRQADRGFPVHRGFTGRRR